MICLRESPTHSKYPKKQETKDAFFHDTSLS
jgi:hypothetical protein